jgi:hypothetical protein
MSRILNCKGFDAFPISHIEVPSPWDSASLAAEKKGQDKQQTNPILFILTVHV